MTFAHARAERLLAYLALNGPSERARVAADLWPGVDRERALASLRQAIRAVVDEGWVVAGRTTLHLREGIEVARGEGSLLEGWDASWIETHRPQRSSPPFDALLELLAWYGERDPAAALRIADEALPTLRALPPARAARALSPILARVPRLPDAGGDVADLIARSHYLVGALDEAYALYDRIVQELDPERNREKIAGNRLSQVVLLRESGAVREAAKRAEIVVATAPNTPFFEWNGRYHLGYCRHLAGQPEGLRMARAAVEASDLGDDPLARLFPVLNVTEGLIDADDPAALAFLNEGVRLADLAGDPLGLLTAEALGALIVAKADPEAGLERIGELERRAWEARLTLFAVGLADRAAVLAHRAGRTTEARRQLLRGERIRKRLGLRRVPIERSRIAPLHALA